METIIPILVAFAGLALVYSLNRKTTKQKPNHSLSPGMYMVIIDKEIHGRTWLDNIYRVLEANENSLLVMAITSNGYFLPVGGIFNMNTDTKEYRCLQVDNKEAAERIEQAKEKTRIFSQIRNNSQ